MSDDVQIIAATHPLQQRVVYSSAPAGSTISEVLGIHCTTAANVIVNGIAVLYEDWKTFVLKAGDILNVRVAPKGDNILGAILQVVIMVVAIWIAGPLGTTTWGLGSTGAAFAAGAFTLVASMALNALIPTQQANAADVEGDSFNELVGITGQSNSMNPYGVAPRCYGTNRIYPLLAANPYTEVVGEDQYLRMLFYLGIGDYTLSDWRIGETDLDDYDDVEVQVFKTGVEESQLYTNDVYEEQFSLALPRREYKEEDEDDAVHRTYVTKILEDGVTAITVLDDDDVQFERTTEDECNEISIDLTFGNGMYGIGYEGGTLGCRVYFQVEYKIHGTSDDNYIPATYSTGFTSSHSDYTVWSGGTTISFINRLRRETVRIGLRWETPVFEKYDIRIIRIGTEYISSTETASVSKLKRTLSTNYDWYYAYALPEDGSSISTNTLDIEDFQVETVYNLDDSLSTDPEGTGATLINVKTYPLSQEVDTSYSSNIHYETDEYGQTHSYSGRTYIVDQTTTYYNYVYRIIWSESDVQTHSEGAGISDCEWTSLRTVVYQEPVLVDDVWLIGMRIKATDQLNGIVDELNLLVNTHIPVYNGSSWVEQATNNPAWAYCDVLTGESNARPISKDLLDLDAIESWAGYCDNENFEYNSLGDEATTVFELAREIAAAGRAAWSMTDGLYSVVRDIPNQTPVQIFTPRTSWDFSGTKTFPIVPHCLRIKYRNEHEDVDYDWDELQVYADGYAEIASGDKLAATLFEILEFKGITNSEQIFKFGRYYLAAMKLRPEIYSLNVDVEQLVCTRGDLVYVSNDIPLWGTGWGRVKTINTSGSTVVSFTVDETIDVFVGEYAIRIRKSDGTNIMERYTSVADEQINEFTPDTPMGLFEVGDLFVLGQYGHEVTPLIVSKIEPGGDLSAKLTLVDEAPDIHLADKAEIPDFDPNITTQDDFTQVKPAAPTITSVRSDRNILQTTSNGSLIISILVNYSLTGSNSYPVAYIDGSIRPYGSSDSWSLHPQSSPNGSFRFNNLEQNATYELRIRSVTAEGVTSDWITHNHTVGTVDIDPDSRPAVEELTVYRETYGYTFSWDVATVNVLGYNIYLDDVLIVENYTGTTYSHLSSILEGEHTLEVRTVDTTGHEFSQSQTITFSAARTEGTDGTYEDYSLDSSGHLTLQVPVVNDPQVVLYEIRGGEIGSVWGDGFFLASSTTGSFDLTVDLVTTKQIFARAKLDDGSYSSHSFIIVMQSLTTPDLSVRIIEPNVSLDWDDIPEAAYYELLVESGGVTSSKTVTDSIYTFAIPKYDTTISVRAWSGTGYFSPWVEEEVSVSGHYNYNEIISFDFDFINGQYLNFGWQTDDTVVRPSVLGITLAGSPAANINDSDLFNFAEEWENTVVNTIEDKPASWFREKWYADGNGWFESDVQDLGATYTGRLTVNLATSIAHHNKTVAEIEDVEAGHLEDFTGEELMGTRTNISVVVLTSTDGVDYVERSPDDWVTDIRYLKIRGEMLYATPLADIVIEEGTMTLDVPDLTYDGTEIISSPDTTKVITFTTPFNSISSVICNADGVATSYPTNVSETGFTINVSTTDTTVYWFAKGY
ncbi:MAG: hypothetical protein GQ540_03690 [Lutibacter sp.]|uniref:hypothetical protein n=1 Tax=Lutibacter sp. TaxID=1925666 RepID=UPI0019ECD125|nr:hypothetical protein [Lutibacter sp.]NOR27615.1 hypothetical protein [Lutibacter sp.]